jgi:proline racemase/trans-L-3-hydroxyproline dehydratase
MRLTIPCVETHTCGEPTRFVTMFNLPGDTIVAKQDYVRKNFDHIRKALVREPRGHHHMFGAIMTAPVTPGAACGIIWFDNQDYLNGCGHATIATGIALVETGMVPHSGNQAEFRIDVPSGLLTLRVKIEGGKARETSFENVPAFCPQIDVPVDVPGIGKIKMDIAYGGNFFGILDAAAAGVEIRLEKMSHIAEIGVRIRDAANRQVEIHHPTQPHLKQIAIITFRSKPNLPQALYLNTHVFADGAVDRSPGGTGTSAVLAALHARGEVAIGQEIGVEGLTGGLFRGRLLSETKLGQYKAVIPEITGPAFVTGFHQFIVDSEDPLAQGFEAR